MASFTLTFNIDNDAFQIGDGGQGGHDGQEIARILRESAERIERGEDHGAVRDINGNRVGSFGVEH